MRFLENKNSFFVILTKLLKMLWNITSEAVDELTLICVTLLATYANCLRFNICNKREWMWLGNYKVIDLKFNVIFSRYSPHIYYYKHIHLIIRCCWFFWKDYLFLIYSPKSKPRTSHYIEFLGGLLRLFFFFSFWVSA